MRTKQEISSFLESKVGTKIPCPGNSSLDGMCVTLIKSLMEFIGVTDPYKARGNAKDCIANYLKEGLAKPGAGVLTVYSNKDMGSGMGHIWCSIDGVFYESNGAKSLTVTKGKTYAYDNVCNFDAYILDNTYRGYDLSNIDSMKICVDDHIRVAEGQLVEKTQYESIKGQLTKSEERVGELSSALGTKTAEAKANFDEVKKRDDIISSLTETIKKLNETDNFAQTATDAQDKQKVVEDQYSLTLYEAEEILKLQHTSDALQVRAVAVLDALQKLRDGKERHLDFSDYNVIIKIGGFLKYY